MRVLYAREYFYPDQTGPTFASDIVHALVTNYPEVRVHVICGNRSYAESEARYERRDLWDGIRITRVNAPRTKHPRAPLRLARGAWFASRVGAELRRIPPDYDVVLVVSDPPVLPKWLLGWARRHRIPVAYMIADLFPDMAIALGTISRTSWLARAASNLQKTWLHQAVRIQVLGECMRSHIAGTYEVPEDLIDIVSPIAQAPPEMPPGAGEVAKCKLGLEGFVVLYAGNVGEAQQLEDLLDAAEILQASGEPAVTFALVGDGSHRRALQMTAQARGLTTVRFIDRVPSSEISRVLACADLAVVTLDPRVSRLAVPSKLFGVMAAGRPCLAIVGDDSEVARLVRSYGSGICVEPGHPDALAVVIRQAQGDPSGLARMGTNGRSAMLATHTPRAAAGALHQSLSEVVAAGESRA
ncbi:MAG: glycosyltransferase family 4 protein [candidate division WS1 bacterium]|jgi:glycosyltransferase involved in cell wall biosynthesis|nr:glycosyltransferase family 4 protein [candidate division WS1 bacterium]